MPKLLTFRVSEKDHAKMLQRAIAEGVTMTEYFKRCCLGGPNGVASVVGKVPKKRRRKR